MLALNNRYNAESSISFFVILRKIPALNMKENKKDWSIRNVGKIDKSQNHISVYSLWVMVELKLIKICKKKKFFSSFGFGLPREKAVIMLF